MKKFLLIVIFLFEISSVNAQRLNSPWETVAPSGSYVFNDLKTAIKDANTCYRLELSGIDFLKDKKLLSKAASLNQLMALRLVNNNLTELPSSFLYFQSLKYFYSAGNPFATISDSIGMWSELRFLELSGTNFDTLPVGFFSCGRLQSILINENKDTLKITNAISSLGKTLVELKIYSTKTDTLPDAMKEMVKLKKLVLYKCGLNEIPAAVLKMDMLQELWLDSNSINIIPRNITSMQSLTHLSLKGNRIVHIPSTICFMQNLLTLDLRGNPIDPYEIHVLQALLPSCEILF
ncbi:hypothetical protein BH09BAC5_BH09BAC5_02830 [soil metagenome]